MRIDNIIFPMMMFFMLIFVGSMLYVEITAPDPVLVCTEDCAKVNMNYFNHEYRTSGLFGGGESANCYCVDGDLEVKQIW